MGNFQVAFVPNVAMGKKKFKENAQRLMNEISEEFRKDLYETLSVPPQRHGKIYLIDGRIHQASAPGEPPAVLSDHLRGTLRVNVRSNIPNYISHVESLAKYAADLELGRGDMTNYGARPAWLFTLQKNTEKYRNMVKNFKFE